MRKFSTLVDLILADIRDVKRQKQEVKKSAAGYYFSHTT